MPRLHLAAPIVVTALLIAVSAAKLYFKVKRVQRDNEDRSHINKDRRLLHSLRFNVNVAGGH